MKNILVNTVTTFFALVMLLPNIANLHSLEHLLEHDSLVSCEYCEILRDQNQMDLSHVAFFYESNELHTIPTSFVQLFAYNISQERIVSPDFIYNKPPPLPLS